MRSPRRALALGAAAFALAATGCGTTVSGTTAASAPTGTTTGGELAAPTAGTPRSGGTTATGSGAVPGAAVPGRVPGAVSGPGGTTTTGPVIPGQSGGVTSGGTTMAPGVTATKIYVGLTTAKNQDAVNKAAGANGIALGDQKANAEAMIADVNKHGGIAGRQIVPVWQSVDTASSQTIDSQLAAACDHFAHDERVFAVIGATRASYRACLGNAGIVNLDEGLPEIGDAEFDKYPTLVELGYPKLSRIARAMLASLTPQDYFSPWNTTAGGPAKVGKAKVGVLTIDSPGYDDVVDNVLIPGLKALGYDPGDDVARIAVAANASDITNQAAANQAAELKFAQDGVTHVVVFEANGGNSLLFMNQAESQHYRPRYAVNSGSGLEVLVDTRRHPEGASRRRHRVRLDPSLRPDRRDEPGQRQVLQRRTTQLHRHLQEARHHVQQSQRAVRRALFLRDAASASGNAEEDTERHHPGVVRQCAGRARLVLHRADRTWDLPRPRSSRRRLERLLLALVRRLRLPALRRTPARDPALRLNQRQVRGAGPAGSSDRRPS